jgi:NitT/TauT family transport system permease protein
MSLSGRTRARDVLGVMLPLVGFILVVALWEALVTGFRLPAILLPSPGAALASGVANAHKLIEASLATATRVGVGFVAGVLVAVPLAVLTVQYPFAGRIVQPLITLSQAVPKVALAPLVVVWFGHGYPSQTAFAALVGFFPIFIETLLGLQAMETEMLLLARSMGSTPAQLFLKFRFPRALPHIFAGLKVGATLAVVGATVAEWIGGETGIALLLLRADSLLDTPLAVAALLVLALMGIAFYSLISLIEVWITPGWARRRQFKTTTT